MGYSSTLPTLGVMGLGYVGCVSAACLASRGHQVIGVDVSQDKVDIINTGRAPVVEDRIGALTEDMVALGRLRATVDHSTIVRDCEIILVCVGTPSGHGGAISTRYLEQVTEQLAKGLAAVDEWRVIAYRSTMVPGTCEDVLIPILERLSGKKVGVDFGVCVNPEFLREGTSVADFFSPPKTVVGESDPRAGDAVMELFDGIAAPRFQVAIGVAEMAKYVDNSFHALKVVYGNEIGAICAAVGLDSHDVMQIFFADTKLNISPAYLKPGFTFGGSCLPKDVRALMHTARERDVDVPLLNTLLPANERHQIRALDLILAQRGNRVGLLGLSFKSGTDDLRESPMVDLAERLLGKGYDVQIHDPNVALSKLVGANRSFIEGKLHHIGDLLTDDVNAMVARSEIVIVGSTNPDLVAALENVHERAVIVDLVRLPDADVRRLGYGYVGIGW